MDNIKMGIVRLRIRYGWYSLNLWQGYDFLKIGLKLIKVSEVN